MDCSKVTGSCSAMLKKPFLFIDKVINDGLVFFP